MDLDQWTKQRAESWQRLDIQDRDNLRKAIKLLAEVHGKRLSDQAILVWCKALAAYTQGKALWRALAESCEDDRMPSIAKVKSRLGDRPELSAMKPIPELTPREKDRSEQAAMLSMLWLHYVHGWGPEDFRGSIFETKYGKDPSTAIREAAERIDRATVERWMQDQIAAGN